MKERLVELMEKCEHISDLDSVYDCPKIFDIVAKHLLANGVVVVDTNKVSAKNLPVITHIAGYPINDVIDLMEAKNAGRIVELPCAVGDTVYRVMADKRIKQPYQYKVTGVWYSADATCNNLHLVRYVNGVFVSSISVPFSEFNRILFLTKEEAEKALERSEGK